MCEYMLAQSLTACAPPAQFTTRHSQAVQETFAQGAGACQALLPEVEEGLIWKRPFWVSCCAIVRACRCQLHGMQPGSDVHDEDVTKWSPSPEPEVERNLATGGTSNYACVPLPTPAQPSRHSAGLDVRRQLDLRGTQDIPKPSALSV